MIIFIEKSYVAAAMMKINKKYFKENYVSKRDMNALIWNMQRIFINNNIDVLFVNKIDCSYFNELGSIILLNEEIDFDIVEIRYKSSLPDEVLSIIWDEDFLIANIMDIYAKEQKVSVKILKKNITNF